MVIVGGQVGIADHCTIEDGAILGAQAGIPSRKAIRKGQTVWALRRGRLKSSTNSIDGLRACRNCERVRTATEEGEDASTPK